MALTALQRAAKKEQEEKQAKSNATTSSRNSGSMSGGSPKKETTTTTPRRSALQKAAEKERADHGYSRRNITTPRVGRRTYSDKMNAFTEAEKALTRTRGSGTDIETELNRLGENFTNMENSVKKMADAYRLNPTEENYNKYLAVYDQYVSAADLYNERYNEYKGLVDDYNAAYKDYSTIRSSTEVGYELNELKDRRQEILNETSRIMNTHADNKAQLLADLTKENREISNKLKEIEAEYKEAKDYETQQLIDSGEYREATLKDLTINSLKQGFYNSMLGEQSYEEMMGRANEKQKYEDILAGDEYKFLADGWLEELVSGAANLAGQIGHQFTNKKTATTTASAATAAASAAAIAGQLGPQVALPEEVITVPAAAIAGAKAGFTAASTENAFKVEAGFAYNEMLENGIPEETAKKIAIGVGGVNAALEMVQIDELLDAFKIVKKSGATQSVAKRIADELLERGIDVAKETAQEVAQEATTIAGAQLASKMETGDWAYTNDEVLDRIGDTAKSSALSFIGLNAPAAVSNTTQHIVADQKQKRTGAEFRGMGDDVVQAVIEEGLESEESTDSHKLAAEAKKKLDAGETLTDREIGQLYQANVKAVAEEQRAAAKAAAIEAQNQPVSEASEKTTIMPATQKRTGTAQNIAATYGEKGAQAFMKMFENGDITVEEAVKSFQSPYEMGRTNKLGAAAEQLTGIQKIAYNAGRVDAIADLGRRKLQNPTIHDVAGFDWTNAPADVTESDKAFAQLLSKAYAVKGVWGESTDSEAFDGKINSEGIVTLAKDFGISESALKVIGGVANLNKIKNIAKVRNKSMTFLLAHEIAVHRMMQLAPEEGLAFVNSLYNALGKGRPEYAGTLAEGMQARYDRQGVKLETGKAIEEIAADAIIELYGGEQKFIEAMERIINGKDEKAKSGMHKYIDMLKDTVEKLKRLFKRLTGKENADARAEVKSAIAENEKLIELFENAQRAALKNVEAIKSGKSTTKRDGKLFRTEVDGMTILETSVGNPVAMMDENGSALFSLKTYDSFGRAELKRWLTLKESKGQITKAEAADIVQQLDEYYDLCQQFVDKYAPFGAWSNASVVTDNKGKPVFSVVKANGEYAMNLDFSLVCKKRRTLDAVFKEMIRRGIMDELSLEEADIAKVNEIIRNNGFETACALCFVDSKRYRQAKVADTFVNQYNDIVRQLIPAGKGVKAHHFDFVESGVYKDTGTGLHTLSDAELQEGLAKLRQIMKENGKQTVAHKIAKHLLAVPRDRKLMSRSDFMNTDGFGAVKMKNPAVLKLYNSSKGAGGPKAAFSDVQYLGEILKKNNFTPARAYAVGGVRIQSFSDYIPRLVFDYMQMVADLSAKKLPVHAYTKEAIFVKQFGMTGIKMNMSLVPAVAEDGIAPGLDKNGDYFWFDGQSFGSDVKIQGSGKTGYDLAIQIQNTPGYSQHCGTVAVGVSNEHIMKMLDDENIRMIIPYHKSSLNHIVAVMNNIDKYTDYTNVQNTRNKSDGKKISGKDFNFNEALRRTGDAKAAANEYLAWCEENGYIPKFDDFAGHENYYKVLEDFSTYDNGVAAPQGAVTMTFPKKGDAFGSMAELIEQGLEEDALLEADREKSVPNIVDQVEKALQKKESVDYSLKGESANLTAEEIADLNTAKAMKKDGKTNSEIRDNTGWWSGSDGKWRFEIDDSKAKINRRTGSGTLAEFLDHADLFSSYPILKNMMVYVDLDHGSEGGKTVDNEIHLSPKLKGDEFKKALLHEIQHTIQEYEGNEIGSNLDVAYRQLFIEAYNRIKYTPEFNRLKSYRDRVTAVENEIIGQKASSKSLMEDSEKLYDLVFDQYYDSIGETEARNTADRIDMTAAQRKANAPYMAESGVSTKNYKAERDEFRQIHKELGQKLTDKIDAPVYNNVRGLLYGPTTRGVNSLTRQALNKDTRFSLKDSDYMDAVNRGDMETAQKMVDEAAKAAGYPVKAYHGTNSGRINKFDKAFINYDEYFNGGGFFFTSNELVARSYINTEMLGELLGEGEYDEDYGFHRVMLNLGERPLIVDADGANFDKIEFAPLGTTTTGRLITYAKEHKYTAVVINNVVDNGMFGEVTDDVRKPSTDYVIFDSSQIKSADPVTYDNNGNVIPLSERFNADNEDIRYSLKEQESLLKENAKLKETVDGLKSQFKTTEFAKVDKNKLYSFAKTLLKDYESGADITETRDGLDDLYTYIANGEDGQTASWNEVQRRAYDVAVHILEGASVLNDEMYQNYKEIRDRLRTRGVSINKMYDHDIPGYESISSFRKANFGKIKITNDGTPVDVVYQDLADTYPELFDAYEYSNQADQIAHIADVLDSMQPYEMNPYEYNMREAATWLANDIIERFYELPQAKPTFADKAEAKLTKQVIKDAKKLETLREQKNARIAKLIADNRERTKSLRKKATEDRKQAIKNIKERHKLADAKKSEARKTRELRAKVIRHAERMSSRLLNGTDKTNVPEVLKASVAEVLSCINMESNYTVDPITGQRVYAKDNPRFDYEGALTKRTAAFIRLKEQYEAIAANNDIGMVISPDLLGVPAEGIKSMLDIVAGYKDVRLVDMNLSQLQTMYDVIRVVEHSILMAGKTLSKARWETIDKAAEAFMHDTATRKTKRSLTEKHRVLDIETPYTFFSHFGEAGHDFYRMLRDAQDREQVMQDELVAKLAEVASLEDRQKSEKDIVEFTTQRGEKLTLSKAHIMNIYLLNKRKQAVGHLLRGGIVQPKIGKVRKGTEAVLLNEIDLANLFEHIKEERKIADGLQKLTLLLAEWGNDASMTVYGIKKFNDPNYWTIHSSDIGFNQNVEQGSNKPRSIANMGSAKSVIPEASNPLEIDSVFEVFDRHASDMLCYSAWLAPMEDANRLFNYKYRDENWIPTGKTVKGIINRVSGEGSTQYWMRLVEDIQNGLSAPADTATEQDVMKAIGKVKKAAVSGNIRVIAQQPTAYARAAAVLDPDVMLASVAKGAAIKPTLDGWAKATKYAPIAARKAVGGYEVSSNPKQLSELMYQPESKIGKLKQGAKEAPLWAAGKADELTWGTIWNACEMQVSRDNKGLKKGTDEFYKTVKELFTEVIDQTQVVDGVLQRSQAMRSGSNFVKQMTAFTGEPTQGANMVIRAYDQMRYESDPKKRGKAIKKLSRAVAVYTFTAVMNAFAQSLVDGLRDDDDEKEYWEKVWAAFHGVNGNEETWKDYARNIILGSNVVNNMNPMSWIPVWKDVLSIIRGYSVERMDAASMSDFFDSMSMVMKTLGGDGKYTTGYAALKAIVAADKLRGGSSYNILRDIEGIVRTFQVETDDYMAQYETMKLMTKPKNNKQAYMNLLHKAYENDQSAYRVMYTDLLEHGYTKEDLDDAMSDITLSKGLKNLGYKKAKDYYDDMFAKLRAGDMNGYMKMVKDLERIGVTEVSSIESAMRSRANEAKMSAEDYNELLASAGLKLDFETDKAEDNKYTIDDLSIGEYSDFVGQRGDLVDDIVDEFNRRGFGKLDEETANGLLSAAYSYAEKTALIEASGGEIVAKVVDGETETYLKVDGELYDFDYPEWMEKIQTAEDDLGLNEAEYIMLMKEYSAASITADGVYKAYDLGVDVDTYLEWKDATSDMKADKDANGKSISGSKKQKVIAYTRQMGLTQEEYDALIHDIMGYK